MANKDMIVCAKLDPELQGYLDNYAAANGVTPSAVIRDALRWYFNLPQSTMDAGWHEGCSQAFSFARKCIGTAFVAALREVQDAPLPSSGLPPG